MAKAIRRSNPAQDIKETINTVDRAVKPDSRTHVVSDDNGRQIEIKILSALDSMRLTRVAGKDAQNSSWMMYATIAASVVSIDGERLPQPQSVREIEAIVQRLDNTGVMAIAEGLKELAGVRNVGTSEEQAETARNLP
jgi:hypothetical protein